MDMIYALSVSERHNLFEWIEICSGLRQLEYMKIMSMGTAIRADYTLIRSVDVWVIWEIDSALKIWILVHLVEHDMDRGFCFD